MDRKQKKECPEIKIFDIAYNSNYDGPGKRVVIFFQGCNANCIWCHSPHSQLANSPLLFNESSCKFCRKCELACANNVHKIIGNKHYINRDNCVSCGSCIDACPTSFSYLKTGTLIMPTKIINVDDLFEKLQPYLDMIKKNGGITLSGGEALLQKRGVKKLLKLCKNKGINTAVETSGLLPIEYYSNLEHLVDYWLFGVRFTTDYGNNDFSSQINETYKIISKYNSKIILRIPIIPNQTDTDWYLNKCVNFIKSNEIHEIQVNPWNMNFSHYYNLTQIKLEYKEPSAQEADFSKDKVVRYFYKNDIEISNINNIL